MRRNMTGAQADRIIRSPSDFGYFDLGRHWNKIIRPVFESESIQEQLFRDFSKFEKAKDHRFNFHRTFCYVPSDKPIKLDSSDWRCFRRGRPFSFDEYICYGACHWIVNALLLTARIVFPDRPWIIVSGQKHSTVWDQDSTFFDMNYFALKVSPEECAINTVLHPESVFLRMGELLKLA